MLESGVAAGGILVALVGLSNAYAQSLVVSDHILRRTGDRNAARRNVIVAGMLGGFLFLIPVMLVHDVKVAAIWAQRSFLLNSS
jgi:hypothetical protein